MIKLSECMARWEKKYGRNDKQSRMFCRSSWEIWESLDIWEEMGEGEYDPVYTKLPSTFDGAKDW